jgi:hypothetical protein
MRASVLEERRVLELEATKIDEHVARLQAQACALRTKMNSLTPLCGLPAEVLGHILGGVMQHSRGQDGQDWPTSPIRRHGTEWLAFIGTCRRIRALALATPMIWADLDVGSRAEWKTLCTTRAGSCALAISYYGHRLSPPFAEAELDELLHRAAHVHVRDARIPTDLAITRYFLEVMQHPPNGLRTFAYYTYGSFTLPNGFLLGAGPTLTRLALTRAHIPALSQDVSFPQLAFLTLSRAQFDVPEHLLTLLHKCPLLEHLHLRKIETLDHSGTSVPESIVFASLKTVVLETAFLWLHLLTPLLPASLARCTLAVTASDFDLERGNAVEELRKQVFAMALRRMNYAHEKSNALVAYLEGEYLYGPLDTQWKFRLESADPLCTYQDLCDEGELPSCNDMLAQAPSLHVYGEAEGALFSHVALSKVDPLCSVEHLVVENGAGDTRDLSSWLRRRFRAGNPVRLLELMECGDFVTDYTELARRVRTKGWVGEVRVEK